jgi:hypothetical protein
MIVSDQNKKSNYSDKTKENQEQLLTQLFPITLIKQQLAYTCDMVVRLLLLWKHFPICS